MTGAELRQIYARDKGVCRYCGVHVRPVFAPGKPIGFDHVQARANGGTHSADNIVVCCRLCNCIKSSGPAKAITKREGVTQ